MKRVAHKRVVHCSGCDRFHFPENVTCVCDTDTQVCAVVKECVDCRVDIHHPIFKEI